MQNNCHLSKLIFEQAKKYGERAALSYRDYEIGQWKSISWNTFAQQVRKVSYALLHLGVKVQENVGIFSQNKPENLFVDFGAYGIRAVSIPFYATSSGAQVAYMLNDAQIRYLFVGEQEQYEVAFSVFAVAQTLERIIIFDKKVKRNEKDHLSVYFDDFLQDELQGDLQEVGREYQQRQADANYEDLCNILYTSGTTGQSKGVMLTYGQYREGFRVNDAVLPLSEDDVFLNFLPFTHIFERAWCYLGLTEGALQCINLRPADVQRSMQEVHPTCMSSVPRFWEKVYQAVLDKMENGSFMERKLIKEALEVGGRYWEKYKAKGKTAPLGLTLQYQLYDKTIIKVLRKTLGLERANFFPTAGAAVSPEVERFVHAAGLNMVVGYGLTESLATVSCDVPGKPVTMGSVGRLIDGIEIKFGTNDEILLRGKTITPGYYKKDTTTKEAIDAEGWFHTGDAGYMKNGELFLRERIKDLFKTSNGKYIAPQMIESKLVLDRYFDQAVVVADKRKFVSALIVPDYKLLELYASSNDIQADGREALCKHPAVLKFFTERIETLQQDLAHYEKIKRFVLLPSPFTMENGELTNTLKVRRRIVYEHYADLIDQIYADAEAAGAN
ncbi:MAG: long-chain fatty acid--CoA ligase [Bacteroidales bacterium]|nr:long-chain fatty acid--CoA ligase [Bacteroidales bacterium]